MKRRTPVLWLSPLVAIAAFSASREAQAQKYSCGSAGTTYSGICIEGFMSSGYEGAVFNSTASYAVEGADSSDGYGGFFTSDSGTALYASSTSGIGLSATSGSTYGIYGTGTGAAGVYGTASTAAGVRGDAGSSGYAGVLGNGTVTGAYGVKGTCTGTGCYAGYFTGDVYINGTVYPPSDERLRDPLVCFLHDARKPSHRA